MKIRLDYLVKAAGFAEEAMSNWRNRSLQVYTFDQVENPLRWYSLAQDAEITVLN